MNVMYIPKYVKIEIKLNIYVHLESKYRYVSECPCIEMSFFKSSMFLSLKLAPMYIQKMILMYLSNYFHVSDFGKNCHPSTLISKSVLNRNCRYVYVYLNR
jgi:hypothetical protein